MNKLLALAALALCAFTAQAQTYTFPAGWNCGIATSPIYCQAPAANGTSISIEANLSWGSSKTPPAVGQTYQLYTVWVMQYVNGVYETSGAWSAGTPGSDVCYGTITNNGTQPYPYEVTLSCATFAFSDGTVKAVTLDERFGIVKRGYRLYWTTGGGTVTLN